MQISYLDNDYTLDLDEIDVKQATVIKEKCGLTLANLEDGLQQADPDALKAIFWLMMEQSGIPTSIDLVNFKIVKFAVALQEAGERLEQEEADKLKAEKAAARKAGTKVKPAAPKE